MTPTAQISESLSEIMLFQCLCHNEISLLEVYYAIEAYALFTLWCAYVKLEHLTGRARALGTSKLCYFLLIFIFEFDHFKIHKAKYWFVRSCLWLPFIKLWYVVISYSVYQKMEFQIQTYSVTRNRALICKWKLF